MKVNPAVTSVPVGIKSARVRQYARVSDRVTTVFMPVLEEMD